MLEFFSLIFSVSSNFHLLCFFSVFCLLYSVSFILIILLYLRCIICWLMYYPWKFVPISDCTLSILFTSSFSRLWSLVNALYLNRCNFFKKKFLVLVSCSSCFTLCISYVYLFVLLFLLSFCLAPAWSSTPPHWHCHHLPEPAWHCAKELRSAKPWSPPPPLLHLALLSPSPLPLPLSLSLPFLSLANQRDLSFPSIFPFPFFLFSFFPLSSLSSFAIYHSFVNHPIPSEHPVTPSPPPAQAPHLTFACYLAQLIKSVDIADNLFCW